MSIVTDALNRLQSMRAQSARPTVAHDLDTSQPKAAEVEEESGESTRTARFLSVSIGSFLVVATMAMGAFWWGESLVENVPLVTLSAPSHAVETPEPSVELSEKRPDSDQKETVAVEKNVEVAHDVPISVSQKSEPDDRLVSSQVSEKKTTQLIARVSPLVPRESHVMSQEKPKEVVDSVDLDPQSSKTLRATQRVETSSAERDDVRSRTKQEARSSVSMDSGESDAVNDTQALSPADSKQLAHAAVSSNRVAFVQPRTSESERLVAHSQPASPSSFPTVEAKNPRSSRESRASSAQLSEVNPPQADTQSVGRLSPEQRLLKAKRLITQTSHAEALQVLNPLFATLPETWEPWFWMGTAQLGVGDLEKAENAFMEGLVRDDTVPHLWVQRAVIDQQRGQYTLAMDALRQAELLAPDLPEVQLNLAYNLEHQGNQKLARRHYQQYLALTEGNSSYHAVRRKVLERVLRLGTS